jgi:hypothetical protein
MVKALDDLLGQAAFELSVHLAGLVSSSPGSHRGALRCRSSEVRAGEYGRGWGKRPEGTKRTGTKITPVRPHA